jgi:DNA-directed RNA polymerase specialized sigma24 family protein
VEDQKFIVAEISKNWPEENTEDTRHMRRHLGERFEDAINNNLERGYRLHSWRLHRWSPEPDLLNETIVAVFEKDGQAEDQARMLSWAGDRFEREVIDLCDDHAHLVEEEPQWAKQYIADMRALGRIVGRDFDTLIATAGAAEHPVEALQEFIAHVDASDE